MNMASAETTLYLVDDDQDLLDAFSLYLATLGYRTELFTTASAFLALDTFNQNGCIVLDNHLPDQSGLEVQKNLADRGVNLPIVFMSGDSEFKDVVSAVRSGAIGFLEKPFSMAALREAIEEALEAHNATASQFEQNQALKNRVQTLTAREHEVYQLAIKGFTIKKIAEELDISASTVEFHRSNILKKLEVHSIAELMAQELGAR